MIAFFALTNRLGVGLIYLWALCSGVIWLLIRPAYKVIITEAVPPEEIRPAVSVISITETGANVLMQAGGSALLAGAGLPIAFLLNTISYWVAAACLLRLGRYHLGDTSPREGQAAQPWRILGDLKEGLRCLRGEKGLLYPLLLTLFGSILSSPIGALLPAIVQREKGSIVTLGILGTALSVGALLGAVFAGMRGEGDPLRIYPLMVLGAALLIGLFTAAPTGPAGMLALAGLGFIMYAQAVWNTSRVPRLAAPAFQARLQALSSMVFAFGAPLGALWGGMAFDRFGLPALVAGAAVMGVGCAVLLVWR